MFILHSSSRSLVAASSFGHLEASLKAKPRGARQLTPPTCWTWAVALNCQISFFDLKILMIVFVFVLICLLIFLLTLYFFRWLPQSAGSRRTRELLCPACCSHGVGWGGQAAPRCTGGRSSQAGQKGKEPVGPRFTHLQSWEAIGTCCSPTLGPDRRKRE